MQIVIRGLMVVALALTAGGCAWVRQTATLKPEPSIAASQLGKGVQVAVRAIDRRPSMTIGYRGMDSKNAAITTDQDVAAVFRQAVIDGLQRQGFDALPYQGEPGRLLTVEVRRIDYTTDMEFWKGTAKVQAELVAWTIKDGARFEQIYFAERSETIVEAPGAKTNERLINSAITAALQKLFDDRRLMNYLAE
jgi:uncharacterized lipoprotein YajG